VIDIFFYLSHQSIICESYMYKVGGSPTIHPRRLKLHTSRRFFPLSHAVNGPPYEKNFYFRPLSFETRNMALEIDLLIFDSNIP
jgi:hypothetical protein